MKPFNLEAALAGKPVVTRDGRPVKIAGYNPEAKAESIAGWVGSEVHSWDKDGKYLYSGNESNDDLFMAPEKREYWINVYRHRYENNQIEAGGVFDSEALAKQHILQGHVYLTTVRVWEEEL